VRMQMRAIRIPGDPFHVNRAVRVPGLRDSKKKSLGTYNGVNANERQIFYDVSSFGLNMGVCIGRGNTSHNHCSYKEWGICVVTQGHGVKIYKKGSGVEK